jgi:hypothetical protein
MRRMKCLLAIIGIGFGLLMPGEMASADPGTVPPGQLPTLTGEWWQWAYSLPASQNPLNDVNGERCMFGQRGPIWFLAGNATAPRSCSVPEGATLFFPIINFSNFNTPNECGNGPANLTLNDLRKSAKVVIDTATDIFVSVDGRPIKKNLIQRVQSVPFEVALPGMLLPTTPPSIDNLCGDVPGGIYSPAVDDGYYVSLGPLTPGNHEIKFGAKALFMGQTITQDNTYNLIVVPVSLK